MAQPIEHGLLAGCGVSHGFGVRGADPADVVRPTQVHGAGVAAPDAAGRLRPSEADAVVSDRPGLRVGVATADCVPILLAARDGRAVAAVHAGWRGLARGVVAAGVRALRERARSATPLVAAIGPHIGPCCYEVDAPVLAALDEAFPGALAAAARPSRPGHALLDLGGLVRGALGAEGLARDAIGAVADTCTRCDAARFHSYRRDGPAAGRLVHFVAARSAEA